MKKMKKLLIANRGEIALRLIRACKDYGLASVAVYADPDADAPFVAKADEAYALKGISSKETYLDIEKLVALAQRSGADALHPGYGFLSERAEFAAAVLAAGLTWIGPDPKVIAALGDKLGARKIAQRVGAPLAAGSKASIESAASARAFAEKFGLPIVIKAVHGGGGRGMRIARALEEVEPLFESAQREAIAAFGRGECFVEQFLERARHVEVQVLADRQGGILILGTRDCSLQRRNQKLIEEAPAPFLTQAQRETFHRAARDICAEARYVGAGTVEFLLSARGEISFLEVNTRLQVEHPVTEETSGIDLVIEQFRIAEGHPLRTLETPNPRGHTIEFRINIEDPGRGFLPAAGRVERFSPPSGPGVRLDSGIETGSEIAPMFDSLAAKLILSGATRAQAIARARRALAEFVLDGVPSVLPFHRAVLQHPDFCSEDFRVHTNWIESDFAETLPSLARSSPSKGTELERLLVEIDGKRVELGLPASFLARMPKAKAPPPSSREGPEPEAKAGEVHAPLAGILVRWEAADGAQVAQDQILAVIEAMKMETPLKAERGGRLQWIAKAGDFLPAGSLLARISG